MFSKYSKEGLSRPGFGNMSPASGSDVDVKQIINNALLWYTEVAIYPIVSHKALSVFKQQTAFAAGFQNFISLFTCFAFSALVTQIINYSAVYSVLIVMYNSVHYR